MRNIQTCKLSLLRMRRQARCTVVNHPLIQRTMVFELNRAHGVRDMLHRVLNRMCEVIQRINAPLVSNAVMGCVNNTIDCRIAHVHVRRCHINLCAQRLCSLLIFARTHFLKQLEVFLDRAVTIRAVLPASVRLPRTRASLPETDHRHMPCPA